MTRQMVMVGFLQAQNCTNLPMSWRHPESRLDFMSADYYFFWMFLMFFLPYALVRYVTLQPWRPPCRRGVPLRYCRTTACW